MFASLAVVLATSFGAVAEISEDAIGRYNEAIAGNDKADIMEAATTLASEAMATPERADAALLAYEAAWSLCRYNNCGAALPAARFAVSQPANDQHPVLEDRQLLVAYAAWKVDANQTTRRALDDALTAQSDMPPSYLSVAAFQDRYVYDLKKGDEDEGIRTAGAAAAHFYPARDSIFSYWVNARVLELTSRFNEMQDEDVIIGMADLHAEVARYRFLQPDPPQWLIDAEYLTLAWHHGLDAYLMSNGDHDDLRDKAQTIIDNAISRDDTEHPDGPSLHDSDVNRCEGSFTKPPKPSYPRQQARDGLVGAAIILFDADANGSKNFRIGAVVGNESFAREAMRSLKGLKWKWEEPESGEPPCIKERTEIVFPFQFTIGN